MDEALVEESLKSSYRDVWEQYRCDDEIEVTTPRHRHLHGILREISTSFGQPISVLDAGCGTGRYFHCLKNVALLVGMDLSPEMLAAARHPVRRDSVAARRVQLLCQNICRACFPAGTFDFIYSLGMFGNGCPVTLEICNRFHEWLKPGGVLFFDAGQASSPGFPARVKRQVGRWLRERWPSVLNPVRNGRQGDPPFYGLSQRELEAIVRSSRFQRFKISNQISQSPLAMSARLDCIARKASTRDGATRLDL